MSKISIVVPCFNEQSTVETFYTAIVPVLEGTGMEYEILYVNDGSRDDTLSILKTLAQKDEKVKVLSFSRNFGQQAAILCGYRHASGDCVMELDVDLQDPVELIPTMIEKWKEGYDVVHGRRTKRKGESVFKKATAYCYYKFLDKISKVSVPRNTGDFKLYDRKVIEVITGMSEKNKYIRGLASWVGFKQTFVDFERNERSAGETKYTLKKMVALAKTGVLSNSNWPLYLSLKTGIFGCFASLACFLTFVVLACCKIFLPLTAWLFPTVTLCASGLALFNAITNLYVEKINDEVQNRPEYIVAEKINLDE